jgi:type III restriction enzyme
MLQGIIRRKKDAWLAEKDCPVASLIQYIKTAGELRDAQIEAIETYLFLKIKGQNKPLWQAFSEGFFSANDDLATHNISQIARDVFESNTAARALYEFSKGPQFKDSNLSSFIVANAETLPYEAIIRKIFYGISYTDYLFSLPMGAGKTYLMAAFIYLDLYFAINEPENPLFARNFIVVAPSGLKSSIIPSLKTIEKFNPAWVLPEPAASQVKQLVKFEVLDQQKAAKKSNKARNPNSQKVAAHQPFEDAIGLVMVINAEKVILDRIDVTKVGDNYQFDFHETDDEKDKAANELRNLIGKIPALQIHIDEVHHAATDDIKLRQVVSRWQEGGTINSVIGYSGTPYLSKPEPIPLNETRSIKFSQITNTVYYYPLTTAVRKFLKKPRVEQTTGLEPLHIIERGVTDFMNHYGTTVYANGTIAKLAIYCGSIQRLEEEIFPHLTGSMGIDPQTILKYHGGNKDYKISPQEKYEYSILDTALSTKKIVLLVQIGKEGWDCKSLTGVVLSQKGDCPANMVLQTSCRCLRQVVKGEKETALIWLNEENAKILDKQLAEEQHTSIQELNRLGEQSTEEGVQRFSRMDYLKLPNVDFFQLKVEYTTLITEEHPNTKTKLATLKADDYKTLAVQQSRELDITGPKEKDFIYQAGRDEASFFPWLQQISKGSFGAIGMKDLLLFEPELRAVFDRITYGDKSSRYFNNRYNGEGISSQIRLAFRCKRDLETKEDVLKKDVRLLMVEKLGAVAPHDKLYPSAPETAQIMQIDGSGKTVAEAEAATNESLKTQRQQLEAQGFGGLLPPLTDIRFTAPVHAKEYSFHFLPYDFKQSRFEMNFLKEAIGLANIRQSALELYYNGERSLTEFKIACYEKRTAYWKYVGVYTPDFLLVQRKGGAIHKAVIIETKGKGFAEQKDFLKRRHFVESEFIRLNAEKFGYQKFDYLYLTDEDTMNNNLAKLATKISEFFTA